jgi:phenylpyruvate tautomerase PptA (4-oxalocrotonate tautomerase family)
MPDIIITGPVISEEIKRNLVKKLTDILEATYKIRRDAYLVIINELPPQIGVGGELKNSADAKRMQSTIIEGPKIDDIEVKRKMVMDITELLNKAFMIDNQHITVILHQNKMSNVAVAGKLLEDRILLEKLEQVKNELWPSEKKK